jgi:hypothetical protein
VCFLLHLASLYSCCLFLLHRILVANSWIVHVQVPSIVISNLRVLSLWSIFEISLFVFVLLTMLCPCLSITRRTGRQQRHSSLTPCVYGSFWFPSRVILGLWSPHVPSKEHNHRVFESKSARAAVVVGLTHEYFSLFESARRV